MIYEIISKNETPISQMHIYLKNKTGKDGGNIPELVNDLAITESINGLYAFAIWCVITDNLKKEPKNAKKYPTKEVMILAFIQYLKGMATTINLNKQKVSLLYDNLKDNNLLGTSPTLLNLDGDLFTSHYDNKKYYSKEAADEAEDSFPYWVIKVVKEIQESNEIIKPKNITYELPYYIQNISSNYISIYNSPNKKIRKEIGRIPPTGIEPVISIYMGQAQLATSNSAWVELDEKIVIPVKHLESFEELEIDTRGLCIPELPFTVCVKDRVIARKGITNHYFTDDEHIYNMNKEVNIINISMNTFGITEDGWYIPLSSEHIWFNLKSTEEPTNEEKIIEEIENPVVSGDETKIYIDEGIIPPITQFKDSAFLIIVKCSRMDVAEKLYKNIVSRTQYKNAYAVESSGIDIVVTGTDTKEDAIIARKNVVKLGCKASIIKTEDYFNN